jgi:hypothetical protein
MSTYGRYDDETIDRLSGEVRTLSLTELRAAYTTTDRNHRNALRAGHYYIAGFEYDTKERVLLPEFRRRNKYP